MAAHGYLDKITIYGHCIYMEGWASDFDLELFYGDQKVPISVQTVVKPEMIAVFGEGADRWGFVAVGLLPQAPIDRNMFTLKFNNSILKRAPQDHFSSPDDKKFTSMIERFQAEIRTKSNPSMLEVGSRARSGTNYRSWFPTIKDYVGIDVSPGPNVDIVGDAHHLSRCVDRKFDFIFSIAVFEHILMPWKVAIEMNEVLRDGGMALVISHAAWPLHEEPWDFFRFSKDSWRGIFSKHTGFEVVEAQYQHPANIVPFYVHNDHFQQMSRGPTYLLSGCLIKKVGKPLVAWDAEVADVYNLNYSY